MGEASREPQNIYDDPRFFAGYSTLERFGAGWERAAERADLLALLPDVRGRRVLDLGCGAGQLARHLAEAGAAEVIGIDVSERMLALARTEWAHPRVTYRRQAIEDVAFPPARFDLVVSSLVLHYVDDYAGLVSRIAQWLAPGGVLVYSTEHPIFTARLPGDGWVLVGDAFGFLDPLYSSGVLLALRSGEMAADAICDGLDKGDTSAAQLGRWGPVFNDGVWEGVKENEGEEKQVLLVEGKPLLFAKGTKAAERPVAISGKEWDWTAQSTPDFEI